MVPYRSLMERGLACVEFACFSLRFNGLLLLLLLVYGIPRYGSGACAYIRSLTGLCRVCVPQELCAQKHGESKTKN